MIVDSSVKSKRSVVDSGQTTNPAQQNIWQEILREAMTKKDLEESHVFIFGDKFSGKRSLIRIMNKELLKNDYEGKLYFLKLF